MCEVFKSTLKALQKDNLENDHFQALEQPKMFFNIKYHLGD